MAAEVLADGLGLREGERRSEEVQAFRACGIGHASVVAVVVRRANEKARTAEGTEGRRT